MKFVYLYWKLRCLNAIRHFVMGRPPSRFQNASHFERKIDFNNAADVAAFAAELRAQGITLIIIDPLSDATGRSSSKPRFRR